MTEQQTTTPTEPTRDVASAEVIWRFLAYQITEGMPGPTSVVFVDHRDRDNGRATVSLNFASQAEVERWLEGFDDAAMRPSIRHASARAYGWSWIFGWPV